MDTMAHRQKQDPDKIIATTIVDSARPSSNGSRNDEDSSMTSPNASQDSTGFDGEESSSSEESDDSTSDEGESENDDIATVKPGSKPNFSAPVASGAPSLQDRLKSFLPQLAEANNKLQQNGFSMEDVKEDEPHIEMNLGLGVLKELNGKYGEEAADSSEDEDEGESEGEGEDASPERKRREKDIMGKLMGGRKNEAAGIEEIG
jgi:hypothetical protein